MPTLSVRRTSIGWIFDGLGFVLIFGQKFLTESILWASPWVAAQSRNTKASLLLTVAIHLYLAVMGLICWIAAAGLKRNKKWGRPVGIGTAILLLAGFPLLTIVAAFLIYSLVRQPSAALPAPAPASAAPKATVDFWESRRKSKAQRIVHTGLWLAAFCGQAWFVVYAQRHGMPDWHPGLLWWFWFFDLMLLNVAIHECGHAAVAWAVGFKFRIISMGPFTFWRGPNGFVFRFDLRLFESGGYMGAVPVTDRNLRRNQILVVAAGPVVNAITCLASLALFLSLPGTSWQSWWGIVMMNITVTAVLAVANLMPLGYCDGSMLLHLIRWTPAGRLLLDRMRVTMLEEEANACHGHADFDREIELKEEMLRRSLAFGQDNALMISACHQALGTAYALVDDWPAAEAQYRKSLEFEGEVAAQAALAANSWSGLHRAVVHRYNSSEAGRIYAYTVALLDRRKNEGQLEGPSITFAMLAQMHERNGSYQAALDAIGRGLETLSAGAAGIPLRAHLLRCKALCHLQREESELALVAARSAAELFRSPQIVSARRNLAWEDIADLGHALGSAGESTLSISLLREGIAGLESGGARPIAAKYRIKLATALRHLDQPEEAWSELPAEDALSTARRRAFLAERVELHLAFNRADSAVADARELVDLWRAHPCAPSLEIASAGALLAKACLAAEDPLEAEAMALQANEVLAPAQHPDAASCSVTLALVGSASVEQSRTSLIEEAHRQIENAVLLNPAEKARRGAEIAFRLQDSPMLV